MLLRPQRRRYAPSPCKYASTPCKYFTFATPTHATTHRSGAPLRVHSGAWSHKTITQHHRLHSVSTKVKGNASTLSCFNIAQSCQARSHGSISINKTLESAVPTYIHTHSVPARTYNRHCELMYSSSYALHKARNLRDRTHYQHVAYHLHDATYTFPSFRGFTRNYHCDLDLPIEVDSFLLSPRVLCYLEILEVVRTCVT